MEQFFATVGHQQTWISTIIFAGFIYGIMFMLEDMINIRGIFRFIVIIILALIFREFGYLIMDTFNEYLFIWTDGSLGVEAFE